MFLTQIVLKSDILLHVGINQHAKIDQCKTFQPNWTKDEESRISTSNDKKNCLMTSYTDESDVMTSSRF